MINGTFTDPSGMIGQYPDPTALPMASPVPMVPGGMAALMGNPAWNIGMGLLASNARSLTPQNPGQAISRQMAQGMQFQQNAMRQQMMEQQLMLAKQRQVREQAAFDQKTEQYEAKMAFVRRLRAEGKDQLANEIEYGTRKPTDLEQYSADPEGYKAMMEARTAAQSGFAKQPSYFRDPETNEIKAVQISGQGGAYDISTGERVDVSGMVPYGLAYDPALAGTVAREREYGKSEGEWEAGIILETPAKIRGINRLLARIQRPTDEELELAYGTANQVLPDIMSQKRVDVQARIAQQFADLTIEKLGEATFGALSERELDFVMTGATRAQNFNISPAEAKMAYDEIEGFLREKGLSLQTVLDRVKAGRPEAESGQPLRIDFSEDAIPTDGKFKIINREKMP